MLLQTKWLNAKEGEEFELKDVFGKFSIDALASSAFGVDAESFTNKNLKFDEYAAELFKQSKLGIVVFILKLLPRVSELKSAKTWEKFTSGDDPPALYPTWDFFELGNFLKWNDPPPPPP